MSPQIAASVYAASTWILPLVIAITFHEASHGFVARLFGDDTAWRLGRVSFNPLKHIDPFGTVLLPGLLLLTRAPFLFGYAKPVPVNFRALRHPKRDSVFVAAAGPAMNLALATLSAIIVHLIVYVPTTAQPWVFSNLINSLQINVFLAVFNLMPIPPLDGGRIAVGVLPEPLSKPLAALEPYGMLILIALLLIAPMLSTQTGMDLGFVWRWVTNITGWIIAGILRITGLG